MAGMGSIERGAIAAAVVLLIFWGLVFFVYDLDLLVRKFRPK
jgi:hypothetical protein